MRQSRKEKKDGKQTKRVSEHSGTPLNAPTSIPEGEEREKRTEKYIPRDNSQKHLQPGESLKRRQS